MKKIRIITFHNAHNYGAMLQAYALSKKIENMDNQVEFIDYRNKNVENGNRIININKNKLIKSILSNIVYYNKNRRRYNNFNKFMNQNLQLTERRYDNVEELKQDSPKADIYITGSDQVWNKDIVGSIEDSYTLNFGDDNVKRISYAASIGKSIIAEPDKNVINHKLERIDYISVREEDAKHALSQIVNKNIEVVLDPTLLIDKKEWESEIKRKV